MATFKVSSSVPSPSEDAEQLKTAFEGTIYACSLFFLSRIMLLVDRACSFTDLIVTWFDPYDMFIACSVFLIFLISIVIFNYYQVIDP